MSIPFVSTSFGAMHNEKPKTSHLTNLAFDCNRPQLGASSRDTWGVISSDNSLPQTSPADTYYTAESDKERLAALSADERCAIEALQILAMQGQSPFSFSGTQTTHTPHRRSKSDADLRHATGDAACSTATNLFRREPEVSKSTQALENLIVSLESQLAEAYREISIVREERDEMARERDEQRQILYDAEKQIDDILRRTHYAYPMTLYMDDVKHLHEMVYSFEAGLLEAGIDPSTLRYHSSLEALRSQLHIPIKAPRGHPSLGPEVATTLARSAHTEFVTPPLTPEPRPHLDLPDAAVTGKLSYYASGHAALIDAQEALAMPRCASPAPI